MSRFVEHIAASHGLLHSLEAITNRRAFLTVLGTLLSAVLLTSGFAYLGALLGMAGNGFLAGLLALVGLVVIVGILLTGFSAVGSLLNDQVRERPVRSLNEALTAGLLSLPRFVGVGLLIALIAFLLGLAIVVLLLLCKIPFLGPILYVLVFPLSVLVIAAGWYAAIFVLALAAPAIWEGNGVMRTMSILWAIIRERLLFVVIQTLLLCLLVGVVATLVMGAVMMGMMTTTGLSSIILPTGAMRSLMGGMGSPAMSASGGYIIAGIVGGGLIMACALVLPALVAIGGNCIIFANASEDLPTEDYETRLAGLVDSVKQKANDARKQMAAAKPLPPTTAPESADLPALLCPKCQAAIAADDVFCGNCGHRLK